MLLIPYYTDCQLGFECPPHVYFSTVGRNHLEELHITSYSNKYPEFASILGQLDPIYQLNSLIAYIHSDRLTADAFVLIEVAILESFQLSNAFDTLFNFQRSNVIEVKIPKEKQWYKSTCHHPICPPGQEKLFIEDSNQTSSVWDIEIGYFCVPCKKHYYKSYYGDGPCKKCKSYFVSNDDRTKCFDPLTPKFNEISEISGCISLSICSIGLLFSFFTILSVIVKSSEFLMSLVQLIGSLIYFVCLPFLYFLEPSQEICASRTLALALFYNLNITFVYTKSIKLLKAVTAKVRSSRSEVFKTTMMQVFMIIVNLIVATLLVIVLWVRQFPAVVSR